ncbi:protein of unknown function DUF4604 [Trinorchestia longiramus]|nr:protein of unknown function DUF4604 [Trinorchestia longiramus]
MAKWTGKRTGVTFNKPKEPSFLKEFKKKAGYKEGPTLQDKFAEQPPATEDDLADNEEDLPQVVSGVRGGVSAAECEVLVKEGRLQQLLASGAAPAGDEEEPASAPVFRKSSKKRGPEDSVPGVEDRETYENKQNKKKKKKEEAEKQKKLLSFDDEDEPE